MMMTDVNMQNITIISFHLSRFSIILFIRKKSFLLLLSKCYINNNNNNEKSVVDMMIKVKIMEIDMRRKERKRTNQYWMDQYFSLD